MLALRLGVACHQNDFLTHKLVSPPLVSFSGFPLTRQRPKHLAWHLWPQPYSSDVSPYWPRCHHSELLEPSECAPAPSDLHAFPRVLPPPVWSGPHLWGTAPVVTTCICLLRHLSPYFHVGPDNSSSWGCPVHCLAAFLASTH